MFYEFFLFVDLLFVWGSINWLTFAYSNRKQIEKLQGMSASDLDSEITKKEGEIAAAESKFKVLTYKKARTQSKHMLFQAHTHVHTLIFAVGGWQCAAVC